MTHGHFDIGYSEATFSKYAFGRGVTKKSMLCTLVKMMTIIDDPLVSTGYTAPNEGLAVHKPRKNSHGHAMAWGPS